MADIQITGGNGFYQLRALSDEGHAWIEQNVHFEPWQSLGGSIGIDSGQLAHDIAEGAAADGLEVE